MRLTCSMVGGMKRPPQTAILALCLTIGTSLYAEAAPRDPTSATQPAADEESIKQLERDRQDAFVRGDIERLDRDTADDYTTINGSGKISTKPRMMENLRQHKHKILSVKMSDLKARIYGDTAILTGDYRDVNVREGVQHETHALFTRVFVKNKG